MSRRTARWRQPPPPILSTRGSARTIECYAAQGKGAYHCPLAFTHRELALINADRQVMIVAGYAPASWSLHTEAVALGSGWLVLGWRMLDGALPYGELDQVDPELADLAQLREPNRAVVLASTIACHPKGSPLISRR